MIYSHNGLRVHVEGETYRILDVDLASFLGYERPQRIRSSIEDELHEGELTGTTRGTYTDSRGKQREGYWLSEADAHYWVATSSERQLSRRTVRKWLDTSLELARMLERGTLVASIRQADTLRAAADLAPPLSTERQTLLSELRSLENDVEYVTLQQWLQCTPSQDADINAHVSQAIRQGLLPPTCRRQLVISGRLQWAYDPQYIVDVEDIATDPRNSYRSTGT